MRMKSTLCGWCFMHTIKVCVCACVRVHTLDLLVSCVAVWNSPVFSCEDAHRIEELLEEASRFDSKSAWD